MLRRTFLQSGAAAGLTAAAPVPRATGIKLGYDVYSIRSLHWKGAQYIDHAAKLGLDTVQISSLNDYESLEPADLAKLKSYADGKDIEIDAGIGSICPTSSSYGRATGDPVEYLRKGLRVAQAVGAKAMRCFMGSAPDRRGKLPIEGHMEATIKVFRAARSEAVDRGVKIALENHNGDLEAREVKTIIEESGKDAVGSCLDTGNPMWLLEDPMFTLETLAPYVATSHFRDTCVYEHPRGAAFQWVALGDGSIDFKAFVARYRELCPHSPVQLEIITGRPPSLLPYMDPDFWKAFPNKRASEFARFLSLVKAGHPFMGNMMIAGGGKQPAAYEAALVEQQRFDLERSLAYAKKSLGLGTKG